MCSFFGCDEVVDFCDFLVCFQLCQQQVVVCSFGCDYCWSQFEVGYVVCCEDCNVVVDEFGDFGCDEVEKQVYFCFVECDMEVCGFYGLIRW